MRLVTTALLALTIAACGPSAGEVSRSTFDGEWPLTIADT